MVLLANTFAASMVWVAISFVRVIWVRKFRWWKIGNKQPKRSRARKKQRSKLMVSILMPVTITITITTIEARTDITQMYFDSDSSARVCSLVHSNVCFVFILWSQYRQMTSFFCAGNENAITNTSTTLRPSPIGIRGEWAWQRNKAEAKLRINNITTLLWTYSIRLDILASSPLLLYARNQPSAGAYQRHSVFVSVAGKLVIKN